MSYVLKDHIGSLYATVTDGEVEYYSFDAWGRERNHNTLQYDNINTTFDRGFCMHEHYRDFGLINMNGRMYDPLVGRMLSPDIVIQNPEYSQSYNRYSYCFNNPLRFTDPSGYVVNDIWPPDDFSLEIDSYISLYDDENNVSFNSYSLDEATGNNLWNVKRKTTYYFGNIININDISVNHEKRGRCVYYSLAAISKSLGAWNDNAQEWLNRHDQYFQETNKVGIMPKNLIDYIKWDNNGKYESYHAEMVNFEDLPSVSNDKNNRILVEAALNYQLNDNNTGSSLHAGVVKSLTVWPDGDYKIKFADPSPKRLLYDFRSNVKKGFFITPENIESWQFIKINLNKLR